MLRFHKYLLCNCYYRLYVSNWLDHAGPHVLHSITNRILSQDLLAAGYFKQDQQQQPQSGFVGCWSIKNLEVVCCLLNNNLASLINQMLFSIQKDISRQILELQQLHSVKSIRSCWR